MNMKHLIRAAAGALLLSGVTGCSLYSLTAVEEVRQFDVPHHFNSSLQVETVNGSVTVERAGVDRVEIIAHIQAGSDYRLQMTEVLTERLADNTLAVSVQWPDGRRKQNEGASFEILVPDADGVWLQSTNGRLVVDGLSGEAVLNSTNGSLSVSDHLGSIDARSTNGSITVSDILGPVSASSTNGRLSALRVDGPVDLQTTNGSISVALNAGAMGPVTAVTTNGSISLDPGATLAGELILSTSNGSFEFVDMPVAELRELSKKRLHLVFDDSEWISELRTTNGHISIR